MSKHCIVTLNHSALDCLATPLHVHDCMLMQLHSVKLRVKLSVW